MLMLMNPSLWILLSTTTLADGFVAPRLFTSFRPTTVSSTVSTNEELLPGIKAIDEGIDCLYSNLQNLRQKAFFRYYSVDILGSCEYLPQELFECYTESCEIYPEDEDKDMDEHDFELDGWARWDMPSDDYYDTETFPEGYTGYDGRDVWNFIHDRICFTGFAYDDNHWKADFNKAVSGLHSVISAQVIRGIRDKIVSGSSFTADEIWRDPKAEFDRRLGPSGETPLAMENLYFLFMLLLFAISKAKPRLEEDCSSGIIDTSAADDLKGVLNCPLLGQDSVSIAYKKLREHAASDSVEALWEARMRCRDLLRIMNCVQCNKCRLHGKISVLGFTTAMQILVGRKGEGTDPHKLHRVELAALMTTLQKCATAIKFCQEMQ